MDAYGKSDEIEQAALTRVAEIYSAALKQALKSKKAFLQKIKAVETGKIKPPLYYVQRDEVAKWKEGYYRELIRQNAVIDGIMRELNKAGVEAEKLIRGSLVEIYEANRQETAENISIDAEKYGVNASFAQINRRQIQVLIEKGQSPFTKLAYRNLGKNHAIRRRLQNELGIASALGESQEKIIERIRKITGQAIAQARRVAQTERTRVQSQARWQAGQEAEEMGVSIENEWVAKLVNSRESHEYLDGTKKAQGEKFHTVWGNDLLYPGDPTAPAHEVINCHCVLVPRVVRNVIRTTKGPSLESLGLKEMEIDGTTCIVSSGYRTFHRSFKTRAATVYTLPDGSRIIYPSDYDRKLQSLRPEDVIRTWLKVPQKVRRRMTNVIEVVDYDNPDDDYWRKIYKHYTRADASTDGKGVYIWKQEYPYDMTYWLNVLCHEGGHNIDWNIPGYSREHPYSQSDAWKTAMERDFNRSGHKSSTDYGESSPQEDFAESVAYYITEHAVFARAFPNRTKLLDELFEKEK